MKRLLWVGDSPTLFTKLAYLALALSVPVLAGCAATSRVIERESPMFEITEEIAAKTTPLLIDTLRQASPEQVIWVQLFFVSAGELKTDREFIPNEQDVVRIRQLELRRSQIAGQPWSESVTPETKREAEKPILEELTTVRNRILDQRAEFMRHVNEYNRSIVVPRRKALVEQVRSIFADDANVIVGDSTELSDQVILHLYGPVSVFRSKLGQVANLSLITRIVGIRQPHWQLSLKWSRPASQVTLQAAYWGLDGVHGVIGILDSGIGETTNLTVADNAVFVNSDADPTNYHDVAASTPAYPRGHGTAVAGVVRSELPDSYWGVAPECTLLNARVVCLSVPPPPGTPSLHGPYWDKVDLATYWVCQHAGLVDMPIVNYSIVSSDRVGTPQGDINDTVADWIAYNRGVLWVGAIGNVEGTDDMPMSPAGAFNAVVASAFQDNRKTTPRDFAWMSTSCSWGSDVHPIVRTPTLSAPGATFAGSGIKSNAVNPAGSWDGFAGTSIAAPHVSAVAALVCSAMGFPSQTEPLRALILKTILINATDPSKNHVVQSDQVKVNGNLKAGDWHPQWGWGVLNAEKAVDTVSHIGTRAWKGSVSEGLTESRIIYGFYIDRYADVTVCWQRQFNGSGDAKPISKLDIMIYGYQNGSWHLIAWDTTDYNVKMLRHFRVPAQFNLPMHAVEIRIVGRSVDDSIGSEPFVVVCTEPMYAV